MERDFWSGMSWTEMSWTEMSWTEMSWTEMSWTEMSWTEMSWTEMSWTEISTALPISAWCKPTTKHLGSAIAEHHPNLDRNQRSKLRSRRMMVIACDIQNYSLIRADKSISFSN
jgi:hypothetical protein